MGLKITDTNCVNVRKSKNIAQVVQDWQIFLVQVGQTLSWQKVVCIPRPKAKSLLVINTIEKWAYYTEGCGG